MKDMRSWLMGRRGRYFVLVFLGLVVMSACSDIEFGSDSNGSSSGGGSSNITDLSGIALTPDSSWHDSYLVGSHSRFECNDCHNASARMNALATEEICAACHIGDYNRTSLPDHANYNIQTQCNACHYSDSFTSHARVSTSSYHPVIESSCETCHAGRQPATHSADGRTSGCASCHGYPDWSATSGFSHTGLTSGCNISGCHTKHYDGFDCVLCHTNANPGYTWAGFNHNRVADGGCLACHGDGDYDDDDDDDHDDDDDDDDDDHD